MDLHATINKLKMESNQQPLTPQRAKPLSPILSPIPSLAEIFSLANPKGVRMVGWLNASEISKSILDEKKKAMKKRW